jgi:hypothetical protein
VQRGDFLRTRTSQHPVISIDHDVVDAEALELQLVDACGSFYVGGPGVAPEAFLEVCGSLAPLSSAVDILHFSRFDRFREILLESPELGACRRDLEQAGFDIDLGSLQLGDGKLLVRADLAWRVVMALRQRQRQRGDTLRLTDVVVSQEFKSTVLEEIRKRAPRINNVSEERLELGPIVRKKRTFVEMSRTTESSISVVRSEP